LLDPTAFDGWAIHPFSWLSISGYGVVLIPLFFIGWMVNGIFPIFMATIPSETVDAHHHATVLGLAMGACEILGGVFGPPAAGFLNDTFGADTWLYLLMILAVISGFVAMGLRETAPQALARKGLKPAAA
jgi:cyanate permease